MEGTPHRVIGSIADGIADGARGLVDSAALAFKGAGESIMRAADGPFKAITGKEGPHRIIDRLADGVIDTSLNFIDAGIIGTAKKAGETVMRALDHLPEQTGIPPKLPTLRK